MLMSLILAHHLHHPAAVEIVVKDAPHAQRAQQEKQQLVNLRNEMARIVPNLETELVSQVETEIVMTREIEDHLKVVVVEEDAVEATHPEIVQREAPDLVQSQHRHVESALNARKHLNQRESMSGDSPEM